jgi:hypothetical protein
MSRNKNRCNVRIEQLHGYKEKAGFLQNSYILVEKEIKNESKKMVF